MTGRKFLPLGMILLLALLVGICDRGSSYEEEGGSPLTTVASLLTVCLLFVWYRRDARERQYETSWGLNASMVLVTAFALPWYLIRSRKGVAVVKALGRPLPAPRILSPQKC
jgi:hypothetical protein